MLVKKVTYFGKFGYLNISCIKRNILMFLIIIIIMMIIIIIIIIINNYSPKWK